MTDPTYPSTPPCQPHPPEAPRLIAAGPAPPTLLEVGLEAPDDEKARALEEQPPLATHPETPPDARAEQPGGALPLVPGREAADDERAELLYEAEGSPPLDLDAHDPRDPRLGGHRSRP